MIALGATSAAALAAVLLLQPCAAPATTGLEVAVLAPPGSTRRGDAVVGDLLRARARADRTHVELRVYLGTGLIARCPGSPPCRHDGPIMELEWQLGAAGTYQIILLSSSSNIPAGDGTIDRDLLEAQGAEASIELHRLTVTP